MAASPTLLYAQSGGMTAVINASAAGVLAAAQAARPAIKRIYAARNGVLGLLEEDLLDISRWSVSRREQLRQTPGGAFGSSRYPLGTPATEPGHYRRLIEVLAAHEVRWFLHNGGGGSATTSWHIAEAARVAGYPLAVIHIPKTVDNDLAGTDFSPGFGSVAKYTAVCVREAARDLAAMARTSTRVFIMEVMGRHAGWIAAASALAQVHDSDAPHLILFPEQAFQPERFLARVDAVVRRCGYCVVVAAEGVRWDRREPGTATGEHGRDLWQVHTGRVAPRLAALVQQSLGLSCHFAISDYLQRSARHLASTVDAAAAWRVGEAAVAAALRGEQSAMVVLQRRSRTRWTEHTVPLTALSGREQCLPRRFISRDGFGITAACRDYLLPLIAGEDSPRFAHGLPVQLTESGTPVTCQLPRYDSRV